MLHDPVVSVRGTRARNALRLRMHIAESGLELFERHGYDETTLEDVARHAGVSVSTLHRYYSAKDGILVGHPRLYVGGLSALFGASAPGTSLDTALEDAVLAFLRRADSDRLFLRRIRALIDQVPSAQARVHDFFSHENEMLTRAVRDRAISEETGSALLPYAASIAAGSAMIIVTIALDVARTQPHRAAMDIGLELFSTFHAAPLGEHHAVLSGTTDARPAPHDGDFRNHGPVRPSASVVTATATALLEARNDPDITIPGSPGDTLLV
jgi:AcrR family transcriptional regulator